MRKEPILGDGKKGDDGIDWDYEAWRASKEKWPYTSKGTLLYLDGLIPQNPVLLDLGCNIAAWYTGWKELRPRCEYHGLDFSPIAIEIAKKRHPDERFYCMDATSMSFKNKFDVIFTHTVLQHMSDRTQDALVPRIRNALVDEGILVIQENIHGDYSEQYWLDLFLPNGFELMKSIDPKDGGMKFVFRKTSEM